MRYALVRDGVVVNVIVWDGESEWTTPEGCVAVECDNTVGPRFTYDGKTFSPPAPEPTGE